MAMRPCFIFVMMMSGLMLAGLSGCGVVEMVDELLGKNDEGIFLDDDAERLLNSSATANGSAEAWAQVEQVRASVLATSTDADGGKSLIEQHHRLTVDDDAYALAIKSVEPAGVLVERLGRDDRVKVWREGGDAETVLADATAGAAVKLRLLGHALTGAQGLFREDYRIASLGLQRQAGHVSQKVEVTGQLLDPAAFGENAKDSARREVMVVWMDAETLRFERLWLRYTRVEGDYGYVAANLSNHQEMTPGIWTPQRIELVHSDEHQQFSERPILRMDVLDMQAQLKPQK